MLRAWFAVAAVIILAAAVVSIALATTSSAPAGGTGLQPVKDYGPVQVQDAQIVVDGNVCGQCR